MDTNLHPDSNTDEDRQNLITPVEENVSDKGFPCTVPCRAVLAFLLSIAFLNALAVRTTFTIAFVAMANFSQESTINESSGYCPENEVHSNHTEEQQGEFNWDSTLQGALLGSFFYGYPITQIPAGYFAERFGAKRILTSLSLMSGVFTIILPFMARLGPAAVIAIQFFNGLFQGPLYPALFAMISRWFPPDERTLVYSVANGASTGGIVISFVVTGLLCEKTFLGGWPAAFYLFGGLSVIWTLIWILLAHESPSQHPRITESELLYIRKRTGNLENIKYEMPPWRSILTSLPVYGVAAVILTDNFGTYVLGNCMTLYFKQVLGIDVADNGMINAGSALLVIPVSFFAGWCADFLRKRKSMRVINIRRLFVFLGEVMPGVCLVLLGYLGCDRVTGIVVFFITLSWNGFSVAGTHPTMFDIAPMYAGTIIGILNGLGNVCGFLSPIIVSLVTGNSGDRYLWREMFYLTCGVFLFGTIVFSLLATDKEETWAQKRHVLENEIVQEIDPE